MEDPDDIYDMADENSNIDTDSVVSPRDLINRLNKQSAEMASRKGPGGIPPKPMFKLKDLKKTQGGLRPVEVTSAKTSPTPSVKENSRDLGSNTSSDTGSGNKISNELTRKFEARRKFSEGGDTNMNTVGASNSLAAKLAMGLQEFEKKRSQNDSFSNSDSIKAPGVVQPEVPPPRSVRPVEVTPPKPADAQRRPPAPLPKNVSLPVPPASNKPLPSPKKDSPPQLRQKLEKPPPSPIPLSPTVKQDANNNLNIEINKRKHDYKFEIITHKGCKYLAYKLPLVVSNKPRAPLRTPDIVLLSKYSELSTPTPRHISFIEPTASDEEEEEEEDVKPPAPLPPPPVHIKGFPIHSTADEDDGDLYDDTAIPQDLGHVDEDDEELYEEFNEEELQELKEKKEAEEKAKAEKREKQRLKDEKKKAKEQKRQEKEKKKKQKEEQERQRLKEKEEQERLKLKEKYKLDGSERVLFSGKAKEKITRNLFETLFEKGDDIPVMRTDESINPKGKWLVQLKDGKYEYLDIKQVETEQAAANGDGDDEENIYEDQDNDGFLGSATVEEEEDIYEDL